MTCIGLEIIFSSGIVTGSHQKSPDFEAGIQPRYPSPGYA